MKIMKLKLFIVALFCSVLGWGQTTIFQFDFEGGTTPSVDNAVGTPAYSVIGTLTSATGTCNGAGSVTHSAWNTNDGYRFTVNTTGYNTLNFSYVERASNTAISTFLVRASTDGSTWTTIRSSYTPGTSCTASGLIALPVAFDNQSNVFIEIFKNVNAGNSGNNFRIDDVTLTGNVLSSNTITTTTPIVGSPFCVTASAGVSVSVPFTSSGTFTGNTYTAQLSNAAGSFASPVNIGTLVSDANSGTTISATIPASTPTGTGYVIRVISNGPAVTGSSTAAFTVNLANNSVAPVTAQNIATGANGATLTVTEQSTPSSRQWYYATVSGGPYTNLIGGATGTTYVPNFATAGTYYVVCVSTFACGTITSNQVQINVIDVPEIDVVGNGISITDGDTTASTADDTDFGSTDVALGTIVKTFTIRNTGSANLTISSVTSSFGEFVITTPPAATVVPGGSTTFQVTFNPTTTGIRFATITINNNDSNENVYDFRVEGRGTEPEMNVQGNGNTIPDNDITPILTDNTNFGTIAFPGTIVKTFTIQNTASGVNATVLNLTGTPSVVISGADAADFTVTTFPSTPITTSGSTTFQITFNPSVAGVKNAVVTIANDDSNENPYNFNIRATATDTPDIVLSSANPAVASSTIVQAVNNHVIYAFDLAVTTFNATLNNVVFNTSVGYAATNITNFKLWYSTDATFNSATDTFLDNETTTLGPGSHTFTGFSRTITIGTTGYFFITTDIPCSSTAGNTIIVDAITTADLTFVAGNKSGTAFASGTHTIQSAIPNNVTGAVTSVCENGTATISWTAPAGCSDNVLVFATSGTFTAAIPTGTGGAYTDNAVFGSGDAFDGGFAVFKGTGTSVTVTGLTNGTTYRFKIFTRNDLNWSNGVEVSCTPTLAYCASGATNTADSEIENVTLVGYSTTISNNTTNACTTGVNNYTAMSADLQVGGTYTVAVEFGDCDGGTQYDGAGGVWIDWNNDGDFLDANETIGTALVAVSGGNVIQNFTINVPGGQPIGNYRMRIVQTEGGTLGTINPCGTFTYGSTEDYTVQVVNACIPTHTVTTFTPTSGPVGTEVTINGTGLTGATVTFSGVNATIVSNSGTQIVAIIPAGATTGMLSVRDTQPCAIDNVYTIISSDVTSCEGASTTDLIIYELHDEQSGDGGFITLYNGTATTVNLADYSIYRAGDFGGAMSNYATLTGTIAPGALGVITVDAASCGTATNGDLSAGFNENDQIQLRNAAGTIVIDDVHAYITGPGYYMVRNAGTLSARTTFVAADWATTPLIAGQCIPSAGLVPPVNTPPTVTTHPSYTPSCSATSVVLTTAGTEGFVGGNALAYQWFFAAPGSATWTAVTDGGIYSGATTASLTISSIVGVIDYQYYCQIRENTATCYTASNAIKITDTSATTWNGTTWSNGTPDLTKLAIINGTYNTTTNGDIDACSIVVNTGFTATITSGHYFNIQNDVTVNGTLNILNNGSLVQINDLGVNTGNISYERITTGAALDYVYWSSPVNGVSTPASGYNYTWNTTVANPNGGQGNWVSATNTAMQPALGYIMRGVLNRNFIGLPRNGVYTPTIARGSDLGAGSTGPNGIMRLATDDNWNLLGNPYPSAISINSFLTANTQLDGFVRLWTHGTLPSTAIADPFYDNFVSNYTASDYVAINGAGATSGPGTLSVIGAGQGFFVLMDAGPATTSTALFNNSMRDKGYSNSQFYRINTASRTTAIAPSERHGIWLDLVSPTNETTRTLVAYVTDATYGRDRMFDAITDYKSAQNFYSIINEDVMTIQGRPVPFDNLDKVPMGVKIPSTGSYTIAIGAVDGIFASSTQDIYLEDLEFGIIHDLRVNPYSFNATQGIHNSRFVLRYTNSVLGNEDFIDDTNTVFVVSNESLTVSSLKENITAIEIYDVLGRKLYQNKNVNTQSQIVNSIQKTNSGLIIYITLENGKQVVKKTIY